MRSYDQTRDERRQIYLGTRLDNRVITMPMGQVYFVPDRKLMTPEQGDRALRDYRNWHHPNFR